MRYFLLFITLIHGLIHLMGFIKAFGYADVKALYIPISKSIGVLWLVAFLLFLLTAICIVLKYEFWWTIALIAIILSQSLIISSWSDAKGGTAANVIILIPVLYSIISILPSSFQNNYKAEIIQRLSKKNQPNILREVDIRHLPKIVQKYLMYTGSVGKPFVYSVSVVSEGKMKQNENAKWLDVHAQQYNFYYDRPVRLYYISSSLFGIPFDGLHVFSEKDARMQIRVAGVFQIVDAKGKEMNKGETVTVFNDMCVLTPSTLIDKNITWKEIDPTTVEATYTHLGQTIQAKLLFTTDGALVNFISNDRYLSADGKKYESYPWSTPLRTYREFQGRRVATEGEAIWHKPSGDYVYGSFRLREAQFNVDEFKFY